MKITVENSIIYLGLTAIIFFLIKAFTYNKIPNGHIAVLTILIMILIIFITMQKDCRVNKVEGYQMTGKPIKNNKHNLSSNSLEIDKDVQDFKDIIGIDKKMY